MSYTLTQRGWEAAMDLPPLTRRNNGVQSEAPQGQLDTGAPGGSRGTPGSRGGEAT